MSLLVVLPFFSGDERMLLKNLAWMKELDGLLDYDCLLACDDETNPAKAFAAAKGIFNEISIVRYARVNRQEWPRQQNNAFMHTAWHVQKNHKGPWLWLETDAVPMCKYWLDTIWAEYQRGGKPFGGHWNYATNVFNGVAIYPQNISRYSTKVMMAALVEATDAKGKVHQPPWDVYGSSQVKPHFHEMNRFMQHIWQDDITKQAWTFPKDGVPHNKVVWDGVVLFHRCKDGTLIDRLREERCTR